MRLLVFLLSMLLLIGIAGASTVTLTGTCYAKTLNTTNNFIQFNITNSGNGTATDLLIEPVITGASPVNNTTIEIPLVAPGGAYPSRIYLDNFSTTPGSYVERFIVRYAQGSSTFTTLFPCLISIGRIAHSLLAVATLGKLKSNVYVNISSIATYPIDAQVAVYAPSEFSVAQPTRNVTIEQLSSYNATFPISTPSFTNSEFPIVVAVSYVNGNVHYSTLAVTTISFGTGSNSLLSQVTSKVVEYSLAAAIIIVIMLILLSIIMNRRKKRKEGEPKPPEKPKPAPHNLTTD